MVVADAHVFPGCLNPVLTQLFFRSHQQLFSHASAEVRGENTTERTFTPTGYQTHNHQVVNPACSPLSQPAGAPLLMQSLKREVFGTQLNISVYILIYL